MYSGEVNMENKKVIQVYASGVNLARCDKTRRLVFGLNNHPDYEVRVTSSWDPKHVRTPGVSLVINALDSKIDSYKNGKPFVTYDEFDELKKKDDVRGLVERVHRELGEAD